MNIFDEIVFRFWTAPPSLLHWLLALAGLLFLLGGALGWRWVWEPRSVILSAEYYLSQRFGKKGRILFSAAFLAFCLLFLLSGYSYRRGNWLFILAASGLLLYNLLDNKDHTKEKPPESPFRHAPVKKTVYRFFGETGTRVYACLFGLLLIFIAGAAWLYS